MKILFCIVLILVLLVLFAVWPNKRRDALRAPFVGHNCAPVSYTHLTLPTNRMV